VRLSANIDARQGRDKRPFSPAKSRRSCIFNIQLPREQEPNPYSTPELTFQFHSFAMRKMHLAMRAAGVVAFPGGFGTLAELFEVLTLVQTRKGRLIPLVCVDRHYWTQVINFHALLHAGVISPADLSLLRFAEDAEDAWQELASSIGAPAVLAPL
jgi:predicted Rossmann-fold nucleotide-binding protein